MFSPKRIRRPPIFFYISDITNSSSFNGKIFRKKSKIENFRANVLKDVRADCYCASLLRTLFTARTELKTQQNIRLMTFALTWCANIFVGCSVTPTFFRQITFLFWLFPLYQKTRKISAWEVLIISHILLKTVELVHGYRCAWLRACSHEGGGPQVGEVPRLGGVTSLSIQSLFFSWLFSHERWGTSPRRVARLAVPGNPLRWGEFSPCECWRWGGVMFSWAFIHYKTNWKADRAAKNVKFNAQFFGWTGLTFLRGYTKWKRFWAGRVGDVHKDTPMFQV